MAVLTSHLLNSIDGTHAGDVAVSLIRIAADGTRDTWLQSATDMGGRLIAELTLEDADTGCEFELVIDSARYFEERDQTPATPQIISQLVVRFRMPDANGKYHIPLMIAPNSYSVWWSS